MAEHDADPEVLLAGRGYHSEAIRDDASNPGGKPLIPTKKNLRFQHSVNRAFYAVRNRVELRQQLPELLGFVQPRRNQAVGSALSTQQASPQAGSVSVWNSGVASGGLDLAVAGFADEPGVLGRIAVRGSKAVQHIVRRR